MNKAKINELARKADGKQAGGDGTDEGNHVKASAKAQNPAAGSVRAVQTNNVPPSPAASADRLQAMIYAALVGGSDFLRTQASEADVCRIAYARSRTAVRIWAAGEGEGAAGVKGKGFVVHVALTSSLDRMDADSRSAVIGAAYSKARGLNDFKLPKRLACFQFLVDGIADEAIAISATERLPPLSGAERAARHRAKVKAESNESNESNARNGVTHKEVSNEVIREARVTPDDLKIAAHNLGIPDDFALGYFAAEMEKLDWMARGANGAMFKVTRTNLASVLRGWWGQENRKNPARASGGVEPAADVPTVTEGDLIS